MGRTQITNTYAGNLSTTPATTTTATGHFVYDGGDMVLALDDSQAVTERMLWGPAVDQILAEEDRTGVVTWALTDNQGTVRDLATFNGGVTSIVDHLVYTSFGQPLSNLPANFQFGYTGRYSDTATGLQWNGGRWYNPGLQRWMGQDPSGLTAGPNPYEYCGDAPVNGTDPTGMCSQGASYTSPTSYSLGSAFGNQSLSLLSGPTAGFLTTALTASPAQLPPLPFSQFNGGGSWLMTQGQYNWRAAGQPLVGRPDGQFMTSASQMNSVISATGGDPVLLGQQLGVNTWTADTPLVRMDVTEPLLANPRLPDASMSGANSLFEPGGVTSGGVSEIATDPLPASDVWMTPVARQPVVPVETPTASTMPASEPGFFRANAGAITLATGLSALNGFAVGMTGLCDQVGIEAIQNPNNNPQDSLEIISYLKANNKIPKTPQGQAFLADRTAYWEAQSGMKLSDVQTPGFVEGVKAIPAVSGMLWNNVNWSEVAADMPSAMQNAILTQLSYIGLATDPRQAEIQAHEAEIQASLPVPAEEARRLLQMPDGGMMSDDDFRIMEQRAEWTKAHPQPDYRSTLGK